MIEDSMIERLFDLIMTSSKADQTEALLFASNSSLTRFAENRIHQNMNEDGAYLSIRAIVDGRTGSASTDDLSDVSLKGLIERALEMARVSPQDPDFLSLPASFPHAESAHFSERTAAFTPPQRAEAAGVMIERAKKDSLTAAGAFSTQSMKVAVANSLGVMKTAKTTEAAISTVFTSKSSSGYADALGYDASVLEPFAVADTAAKKALMSLNPKDLAAGRYAVILEPAAVADMLAHLAFSGFSALAYQEKRSFLNGRMGERIAGSNITIYDDALAKDMLGLPFDYEGMPKKRVTLIDKGIASGLAHDSYTANRQKLSSTGHALPAPNPYGPQAQNVFLEAGTSSLSEMILGSKKAIHITRFHYTNIEDPMKTIMTGMTRDGTFLVERGRVTFGIKNLRFTQSILEALSNVEEISKETELKETFLGYYRVPCLKINGFNFTSETEF